MTIIRNASGAIVCRSRNLRGLLEHARREVPIAVDLQDTDGRFLTDEQAGQPVRRYEVTVTFGNGDVATCFWADWRVCADWLRARRSWPIIAESRLTGPRAFVDRYWSIAP